MTNPKATEDFYNKIDCADKKLSLFEVCDNFLTTASHSEVTSGRAASTSSQTRSIICQNASLKSARRGSRHISRPRNPCSIRPRPRRPRPTRQGRSSDRRAHSDTLCDNYQRTVTKSRLHDLLIYANPSLVDLPRTPSFVLDLLARVLRRRSSSLLYY